MCLPMSSVFVMDEKEAYQSEGKSRALVCLNCCRKQNGLLKEQK